MSSTAHRRPGRWLPALFLSLTLLAATAACGDDKDDTAKTKTRDTSKDTTASSPSSTAPEADFATFCDTYLKLDVAAASVGEDPAAAKAFAIKIKPDLATLTTEAPDELADAVKTLSAAVDKVAGGDPAAFETDEFGMANTAAETWLHENCGYQAVDVKGVDYGFEGITSTLEAGKTSFVFTNGSNSEAHVMVIVRKKPGVTESTDELLALPEEEAMAKVDQVAAAFAPPGQTGGILADLTPGSYVMLCPIPVDGKDGNPPHFTRGMVAEFTVA